MRTSTLRTGLITSLLVLLGSFGLMAQGRAPATDTATIDAATRAAVIEGALAELRESYVFPDIATTMTQAIQERQQRQEYDSINSPQRLAETLTAHLREVSQDQHIRVFPPILDAAIRAR